MKNKYMQYLLLTLTLALTAVGVSAADYTVGLADATNAGTTVLTAVDSFITKGATIKFALLGISMVVALAYWAFRKK